MPLSASPVRADSPLPCVTRRELAEAAERIGPYCVRTPVVGFDAAIAGAPGAPQILCKLDMLQSTGSFKIRSAANSLLQLHQKDPRELQRRGVCTASSGNWAQSVALMCRELGCPFTVAVPLQCPEAKLQNITRIYPAARVHKVSPDEFWTVVTQLHFKGAPDAVYVSPVIDRETVAGNGTMGLELLQQVHDFASVDAVLVPTGGGALAMGIAAALEYAGVQLAPGGQRKVWAVEVETAAPFAAAFAKGEDTLGITMRPTFVDCIGNKAIFPGMWRLAEAALAGSLVVTPAECATAVKLLVEQNKVVAEGGSAASLAAALKYSAAKGWKRVVCVVSGGQIDTAKVVEILGEGTVPGEGGLKLARL